MAIGTFDKQIKKKVWWLLFKTNKIVNLVIPGLRLTLHFNKKKKVSNQKYIYLFHVLYSLLCIKSIIYSIGSELFK